jgi:YVTN family beta-propeller protein
MPGRKATLGITSCKSPGRLPAHSVLNDLSGRYVYVADTGNVVDTSTLSVVTTLPALQDTRLLVEIDWMNGTPNATSTRFGLGRVTS